MQRRLQFLNTVRSCEARPISRSLATSCVCLELRSLPSPGVTRLHRYCEPLRRPAAPGLSLAGVQLVIPDHVAGLPVLRTLSFMCVPPPLPRCSGWASSSLISPSRISLPRKGRRVGLHIVLFEACSAFTRVAARTLAPSPKCDLLHRRLQPFRHLHDCSGCFRLERFAGWDLHPLESAAFHGAHPLRTLPLVQKSNSLGRLRYMAKRRFLTIAPGWSPCST